jgi:ATP-dependent 26S proteasome regulatory subunit
MPPQPRPEIALQIRRLQDRLREFRAELDLFEKVTNVKIADLVSRVDTLDPPTGAR